MLAMASVAYYVTPYELVTKLWLFPGALIGVLFPVFAATVVTNDTRLPTLLDRGMRLMLLCIFPLVLVAVGFAREGLTLWINATFAREGAAVLQWLAIGVLVNCVAQLPFTAIQAIGRPDLTAKLHLAELPCYAVAIWFLGRAYGLPGVAAAWTLRAVTDAALLFAL